mmetsp:Transcript_94259/g.224414  ORF Transcript_94259/g.224414 Transcript_94259/m.224414 type:complete len:326 (+) Transcript_94259:2625-3602(+)
MQGACLEEVVEDALANLAKDLVVIFLAAVLSDHPAETGQVHGLLLEDPKQLLEVQEVLSDVVVRLHPAGPLHLRAIAAAGDVEGVQGAHVVHFDVPPQLPERVLRDVRAGLRLLPKVINEFHLVLARPLRLALLLLQRFQLAIRGLFIQLELAVDPLLALLVDGFRLLRHGVVGILLILLPATFHLHWGEDAQVPGAGGLRPLRRQALLALPDLEHLQVFLHGLLQAQAPRAAKAPGVDHRLIGLLLDVSGHGHAHRVVAPRCHLRDFEADLAALLQLLKLRDVKPPGPVDDRHRGGRKAQLSAVVLTPDPNLRLLRAAREVCRH